MKINPLFLYYLEQELQKYENDPEHYKSYEDWGKELVAEYNKCIESLKRNEVKQ